MSDRAILAIQVSGIAVAAVALFFLHYPAAIVFTVALAVHLVGDFFRLHKDKVI